MDTTSKTLSNTQEAASAASTAQAPTSAENVITLPIVVSEWQKNSREILRVRFDTYKGQTVIDCRAWYGETDNLKPGRGGLTLSTRHLKPLTMALMEALTIANKNHLVQEGGEA